MEDSASSDRATIICVTAVKNERWILAAYLEAASAWADVIVVGDNGSTDDSREIAARYPKVSVVDIGQDYDEFERRRQLFDEARRVPGRRLIFSLDADEMLSTNWSVSDEWQTVLDAPSGTRLRFDWMDLLPGAEHSTVDQIVLAFVDDGAEYVSPPMHSPRVPPDPSRELYIREIKVLHFDLIDSERQLSKHRFYKCLNVIEHGQRPIDACIEYQDTAITTYDREIVAVEPTWIAGLAIVDIINPVVGRNGPPVYWYDRTVLDYFERYGVGRFSKVNIWDVDWAELAAAHDVRLRPSDPRTSTERVVHRVVGRWRPQLKNPTTRTQRAARKILRRVLKPFGW